MVLRQRKVKEGISVKIIYDDLGSLGSFNRKTKKQIKKIGIEIIPFNKMLSKFSVKKPYTVFVAIIAILVLGVVSFLNLTPDLLPNIDFPYVIITTTYPGASPEEHFEKVLQ